jgi:hypothetical protein
MLTKEELKLKKLKFWGDFKSRMHKHRSSNGRKMNWLSYPTEIKDIYLRMEVDKQGARICFDIQAKDEGIRSILWEQMYELKNVLTLEMGEGEWIENHFNDYIASFNRIQWELKHVNFFNDDDHEVIYAFFEEKLLAFDSFYQDFKEILTLLAN